jgi:flagellar protein FlgJ
LQKAGYATDPDYAAKLSRAIHTTTQLQRLQT